MSLLRTFIWTLPSKSSYACGFKITDAHLWEFGFASKLVLNNVSIRVDFPIPVSPKQTTQSALLVQLHNLKSTFYQPEKILPIHNKLNTNPFCTALFTSWSGRLSNPTWPAKPTLRALSNILEIRTVNVHLVKNYDEIQLGLSTCDTKQEVKILGSIYSEMNKLFI